MMVGRLAIEKTILTRNGHFVARLSPSQRLILMTLHEHLGDIVSAAQLLHCMSLKYTRQNINCLRVLVCRLRHHLRHDPYIRLDTVPGTGYRLILDVQNAYVMLPADGPPLNYNGIQLFSQQLIMKDGSVVGLKRTSYDILKVFFSNPDKLIRWPTLLEELSDRGTFMSRRVFDVQLSQIRRYLARSHIEIVTRYKAGHILKVRDTETGKQAVGCNVRRGPGDLTTIYKMVEQRFREEILDPAKETIIYTTLRNEFVANLDRVLLNVRRRYTGYIRHSYRNIAIIINRNLPDCFY